MAKYDQLSDLLRKRIQFGDYVIRELPAERRLAECHGVSYMTARRAVQQLINDGLLTRGTNGRLEIIKSKTPQQPALQIAFLLPFLEKSPVYDRWSSVLSAEVSRHQGNLRQIFYIHWDDPLIQEILNSFDGVFLLSSTEPVPIAIQEQLRDSAKPLISLDEDLSHLGIPSIQALSPFFVGQLLDHLEDQGYRNIYCLNVQPCLTEIKQRIEQWQIWMAAHGMKGLLLNEPVEPYGDLFTRAYEVMQRIIANGQLKADALFCVTFPAALGAMRAMHDAGIRPGEEIAISVVDGEGLAAFQIPSITALEVSDTNDLIGRCLQWMLRFPRDQTWRGSLLMQPSKVPLVVRESTNARLLATQNPS